MKALRFPDSLVLIFSLIVAAQLLSYVLPAGKFEQAMVGEPGHEREQVVPGSYQAIPEEEREPLPAYCFLTAIPKGMSRAADIIFFVFIVGGVIGVMRATGAIDALIGAAIKGLGKSPILLVGGMTHAVRGRLVDHRHGRGVHALHPAAGDHVPGAAHGRDRRHGHRLRGRWNRLRLRGAQSLHGGHRPGHRRAGADVGLVVPALLWRSCLLVAVHHICATRGACATIPRAAWCTTWTTRAASRCRRM